MEVSANMVSNLAAPLTDYLDTHKTKIKLGAALYIAYQVKKKIPAIRETWRSTAPLRTIGKFAINQYFQSPSTNDIMQEQQEKYDNLYTKHYSRNATTIACKFSVVSIESIISNTFNPKMKKIRMEIASLKPNPNTKSSSSPQNGKHKNGQIDIKQKKYALFKELFCVGVCRSICYIFMNTLYHTLLHIVFAMIARRNLYKSKNKQKQNNIQNGEELHLEHKRDMEEKRKLFEIIKIFHKYITGKIVISYTLSARMIYNYIVFCI